MARTISVTTNFAEDAPMTDATPEKGLEGRWLPLLNGQITGPDETYTNDDLDKIVNEYQSRTSGSGSEAPVGLGMSSVDKSETVGKIGALKRVGPVLYGQFSGVDPRAEHLYSRGAFPKKSVEIHRSPEGDSLKRVGLIHTSWSNGSQRSDQTPSLDTLMQKVSGDRNYVFGEGGKMRAVEAIANLKKRGRWSARYDRAGLPAMFAGLEGTSALGSVASLIDGLIDTREDSGALFSECVKYYAREHQITFGEALAEVVTPQFGPQVASGPNPDPHGGAWGTTISPRVREQERQEGQACIDQNLLPEEIVKAAWTLAESEGAPFNWALKEVQTKQPGLGIMQSFQIRRRRERGGT